MARTTEKRVCWLASMGGRFMEGSCGSSRICWQWETEQLVFFKVFVDTVGVGAGRICVRGHCGLSPVVAAVERVCGTRRFGEGKRWRGAIERLTRRVLGRKIKEEDSVIIEEAVENFEEGELLVSVCKSEAEVRRNAKGAERDMQALVPRPYWVWRGGARSAVGGGDRFCL